MVASVGADRPLGDRDDREPRPPATRGPGALAERFKPPIQAGQPRADKLVVLVLIATFAGAILFIPRDVFVWRLLPPPGGFVAGVGLGLYLAGSWIVLAAMRANAFAVPVVKDQSERRQRVVDSGPYALVRHPMYAGVVLALIGMPLWLGSTAGAFVALAPIAVLAVRIGIEGTLPARHARRLSGLRRARPGATHSGRLVNSALSGSRNPT